jgi:hypothetical protein
MDDSRKHLLDAIEVLSEIYILDVRQVSGLGLEIRWQRKSLLMLYELPHVMDGVVGLPLTVTRLLDAGELRYVGEYVHALLTFFLLEHASHEVVAGESMIQNRLDIAVVFPRRTPRVEIRGV